MALTVGLTGDWLGSQGNRRTVHGTITFDDSYATGGESLTPANIGLGRIDRIQFNPVDGYTIEYDYATQKVKVYTGSAGVAAHTHGFKIVGGGTIVMDGALGINAADEIVKVEAGDVTNDGEDSGVVASAAQASEAGTEVAAAENLETLVVEFFAVGV